jgi:hypothetical protein
MVRAHFRVRDCHPLWRSFPESSTSNTQSNIGVLQPREGNPHGLGSSAFARRYLRNRFFFLFLWLLRCFSSPGCYEPAYVFSWSQSGIPGSLLVCQLPQAFRRLPRPSFSQRQGIPHAPLVDWPSKSRTRNLSVHLLNDITCVPDSSYSLTNRPSELSIAASQIKENGRCTESYQNSLSVHLLPNKTRRSRHQHANQKRFIKESIKLSPSRQTIHSPYWIGPRASPQMKSSSSEHGALLDANYQTTKLSKISSLELSITHRRGVAARKQPGVASELETPGRLRARGKDTEVGISRQPRLWTFLKFLFEASWQLGRTHVFAARALFYKESRAKNPNLF